MSSIFTKIIAGEIPCYKIAETENCLAFLDVSPLHQGHTLVIPKEEVDYIFDLEDDLLTELNLFAKKVAKAVKKTIDCTRIGVAVIGLEVPHTHIHLVPINNVTDIDFGKERVKLSPEQFQSIAQEIASNFID